MIPSPEEVTAAWLTEQLRKSGIDRYVTSFTQERIGTGQIGMCIRYQLQFDGNEAPKSVVGKFASPDPLSSATGVQLLNCPALSKMLSCPSLQQVAVCLRWLS